MADEAPNTPKLPHDDFIRVVAAAAPPFTDEVRKDLVRLLTPSPRRKEGK